MKQKPYCYALSTPIQTSTIVCFKEYKPEWDFTIPLYLEPDNLGVFMHDDFLIEKMKDMKAAMCFISEKLTDRGNGDHGSQLKAIAEKVQSWIDGIDHEKRTN